MPWMIRAALANIIGMTRPRCVGFSSLSAIPGMYHHHLREDV